MNAVDCGALGGSPRPLQSLYNRHFAIFGIHVIIPGYSSSVTSWLPSNDSIASVLRSPTAFGSAPKADTASFPTANLWRGGSEFRILIAAIPPEPTSTYLVLLQIGMYGMMLLTGVPVLIQAVLPELLRRDFDHDLVHQPETMNLFVELFVPYLLATGYTGS